MKNASKTTMCPSRVNPVLLHPEEQRISLNGDWRFRLDPDERGLKEHWFDDIGVLTDSIQVPGCWQGQGFGNDAKETLWDFRLEARTLRATYTGTGWYGRKLNIPADWNKRRIWLNMGGAHPSAEVWLNGTRLGENNLPFVSFGFDISDVVRSDNTNWLAVRVHEQNRLFGLSYNFQGGNWSGLYRGVELTATGTAFLKQMRIYPEVDRQVMRFHVEVGGGDPAAEPLRLQISVLAIGTELPVIRTEVAVTADVMEHELSVPAPRLWSPDTPNLYRVDAALTRGNETLDAMSERVGFVQLTTKGRHFLINGEPYYMRGTADFLAHPETGSPDTDRERWRRKLATLRAYGYNYVRCQSYVPAPEYFDVADEVGLLVQSEMGMLGAWGGHDVWHGYAWPQPTPGVRQVLKQQWDMVVLRDVNHPSANIYCMSNELRRCDFPRLAWKCYQDTKAIKPAAMVIWTDGGAGYIADLPGDFVNADVEDERCSKPVIQHEFRWWSSFPDVRIMHKYSGAIRPYGAEIALEAAARQGLAHLLPQFAEKSQRLQLLEAKAKMEICRRDNPRLAGICHFNAMDANLSPQGIIDEFYERKLADAATWLQTNGDTVIMSSLEFDDRTVCGGTELKCNLFVSDFSHPPMTTPALEWRLVAGADTLASGKLEYSHQAYCTCPAGEVNIRIPPVTRPMAARLEASLQEGNRTVTNTWNLWLFPGKVALPPVIFRYGTPKHTWLKEWSDLPLVSEENLTRGASRVVLAEQFDERLLAFMRTGGRVILVASEGMVRPHLALFGYVKYFFTPPANYGPYEDGQNGTIIRNHPMLGDFPHEGFADFQFFRLMEESPPIELKPLDLADGEPVIRVIHRYPVCHSLGYLVERYLGKGGLIVCALNLDPALTESRYLLAQIGAYAASERFRPPIELSDAAIFQLQDATALPYVAQTLRSWKKPLALLAAFRNPQVVQEHNKQWRFQTDVRNEGLADGWMKTDLDDKAWPLIDADRCWQEQGYPDYRGVAWYRRSFTPPAVEGSQRLVLYFGAVDGDATVFVNGKKAGEHNLALPDYENWDKPFYFDITDFLVAGKPNMMAVRVKKIFDAGGIFKGVRIIRADEVRLVE